VLAYALSEWQGVEGMGRHQTGERGNTRSDRDLPHFATRLRSVPAVTKCGSSDSWFYALARFME